MTAEDMRRSLSRIALEVVERNRGLDEVVLVGIQRRGFPLAGRLAADLGQLEGVEVPVGALDINLYRDDLQERAQPLVRPTQMPFRIDGKRVVLVDDVLFTGRDDTGGAGRADGLWEAGAGATGDTGGPGAPRASDQG